MLTDSIEAITSSAVTRARKVFIVTESQVFAFLSFPSSPICLQSTILHNFIDVADLGGQGPRVKVALAVSFWP